MTNEERWAELLKPCTCEPQYTIEPHGKGYALYHGRCGHRHGYNLAYITEPAANCDLKHIERLLNVGDSFDKEKFAESIVQECCDIIAKEGDNWLEFGKNPPSGQENHASAAIFTAFRLKEDTVAVLKEHFGLEE